MRGNPLERAAAELATTTAGEASPFGATVALSVSAPGPTPMVMS